MENYFKTLVAIADPLNAGGSGPLVGNMKETGFLFVDSPFGKAIERKS